MTKEKERSRDKQYSLEELNQRSGEAVIRTDGGTVSCDCEVSGIR
ncbi:MAG: hypothetical protein ACRC3H_10150 [Lachnospiraceae bacterium]